MLISNRSVKSVFENMTGPSSSSSSNKAKQRKRRSLQRGQPIRKKARSKKRGGKRRNEFIGKGLFENIRNWFTKTAYKMTPVPKKLFFAKVLDKKTGKWKPASVLPREFWKSAGVPKAHLDKFHYIT